MYSRQIQPQGWNRVRGVFLNYLKAGCLLLALIQSSTTFAQWQDPLNTPAIKAPHAYESLLLDIARADQRLVAVGAYGIAIYSDDNGVTWQQAEVPVSVTLTRVFFASGQIGWAAGHDGVILKTIDGGAHWEKQFDGFRANKETVDGLTNAQQQAEKQLEQAQAKGNDAAIEQAEQALENIEYALTDARYDLDSLSTKPFLDIWFYDAKLGFAVGAYGMFFYTEDGGAHWQDGSVRLLNPNRFHLNGINFVGGRSLMVVGEAGLIRRSDDMGKTWVELDSPYEGSLFGLAADGNTQLLYGLRGHVYYTNDGGISWQEQVTGSEQTLLASLVRKNSVVLVGNAGAELVFDKKMQQVKVHNLVGSKAYSGLAEAVDGTLILVGEAGIMRFNAKNELINHALSMKMESK